MPSKYSVFLLLLLVQFTFRQASAQTISPDNLRQLKVEQLSDQQVQQIYQQFQRSGVTEDDAIKILIAKGLPSSEAAELKLRLARIKTGAGIAGRSNSQPIKDSISYSRDTLRVNEPLPVKKQSPVYGFSFFSNPRLKFEPNIRIATPKNYVLGPDDELIILLTGLNESTVKTRINPEGSIQIPHAGLVYLNGFTIEQAQSLIKAKMKRAYPALGSGQTQLTVNLGNVRSIRVTIIGEVVQPGTYTLSSLSTLFNALYQSGGPSPQGSLRNIQVIRNNKVIETIDFYTFLQQGIFDGNVRLQDQDVIRLPVYKKRVAIAGEVKKPALYELKETETLQDLIAYAGGFSDVAYKSMAKVVQTGDKERNVKDVPAELFDRFVPRNADSVNFSPVSDRFSNRIVLQGAVYRPGVFELIPGLTLSQLIHKADGIRDDAFLSRGYIKRTKPTLEKEMISFDLRPIVAGTASDIPLMREDSVFVLSNVNLKDELSITIDGFVRYPGTFTYRTGMQLADVIAMAGGFTNQAANHRVEISRLLTNRSDTLANKLVNVLTLEVDSTLNDGQGAFTLSPLDYIYVPRLVNYRSLGNVNILGEVLFPGDYALQRRDETIADFIKRAGGLTPYGSLANTKIYRNGIRVDVSLAQKDNAKHPLLLIEGDSIVVPRETPFVEVAGAVNTPQLLAYSGKGFKQYIRGAGGAKENARLKGAYVQYPNGINNSVGSFLFFRTYPRIKPGSKIIVPESAAKFRIGLGEISAATSVLTVLITLISVLSRN